MKAKETAAVFSDRVVVDARVQELSRPWTDGDHKSFARDWLRGEPVEGREPREAVLERMSEAVDEALEKADGSVAGAQNLPEDSRPARQMYRACVFSRPIYVTIEEVWIRTNVTPRPGEIVRSCSLFDFPLPTMGLIRTIVRTSMGVLWQ